MQGCRWLAEGHVEAIEFRANICWCCMEFDQMFEVLLAGRFQTQAMHLFDLLFDSGVNEVIQIHYD